ncbi:MAG: DEAD/DEAH box helicase, partial [Candidatus Micrarchaeota archaeon]|nr:DEAD/DEAH box helicase [Candidatus Micrarchaeota archaeon]
MKPIEIFGEDYDAQIAEAREKGGAAKFSRKKIAGDAGRVLDARGIRRLYSHQAKGLEELKKGKNVVITAPTASGKTEVYLIPVAEAALAAKTSLVIYPTKALSRDQLDRFREFSIMGLRAEVYDGDTTQHMRRKIRENPPHVLITNMDMLHYIVM